MSGIDVINGVLPIKGLIGFVQDVGDVVETIGHMIDGLKNPNINNVDGIEYTGAELERINSVSDVMAEVFTDEVIGNWENLTVEERTEYLNEYYQKAGEALGIETKGVYVDDLQSLYGTGTMGVNSGNGWLGIDITQVEDPTCLEELLNTTTHEMRHQFQHAVLENPDDFPDISEETREEWLSDFKDYIDPSYDLWGYYTQEIERDARGFAQEVVHDFLTDKGVEELSAEAPDSSEGFEAELETDADEAMAWSDEATDAAFEVDSEAEAEQADNPEANNNDPEITVDDGLNKGETTETFSNGACDKLCLKCKVEVGFRT